MPQRIEEMTGRTTVNGRGENSVNRLRKGKQNARKGSIIPALRRVRNP